MSRLWHTPPEISVLIAHHKPITFTWQGERHQVARIAQYWRLDVGWWRVRLWRDYYKVTTDTGLLVLIYRNLLTNTWYLERLYD